MDSEETRVPTEDLVQELERRKAKKKGVVQVAKQQATGVTALLIAAFGAYEGYTNKEVAKVAAQIAAEAKVNTNEDRKELVEAINKLKSENADLRTKVASMKDIEKERYDHLREWLRNVSQRTRARVPTEPEKVSEAVVVGEPEPAPDVKKLLKTRKKPPKEGEYQQQVQKVLMEKGL